MRSKLAPLWNLNRSIEVFRCIHETEQWLPLSCAYLGFRDLTYPYPLRIRGMRPVMLKEVSDVWAFWQIFLRRVYEITGGEKTVLDAGANIGFFTLWAARLAAGARIFSIEPAPESYDRLRENVRANGWEDRVSCLQFALAGVSETRMVKMGKPKSQARRVLSYDSNASEPIAAVTTKTLAQVFEEQGIDSLDVLKMDIEGGEYETLLSAPSAVLRKIGRISLEYHPDVEGYTTEQLLTFLAQQGFTLKTNICNRDGFGLALLENSARANAPSVAPVSQ